MSQVHLGFKQASKIYVTKILLSLDLLGNLIPALPWASMFVDVAAVCGPVPVIS